MVVKFDRAREKRRAKFAYNLYKFKDYFGRKLAQNESGITAHKAAVNRYIAMYGPVKTDYEKVYFYIRRGVGNEIKRASDNIALRKKLQEAKVTEDIERIAQNRKIRAEQQNERDKNNAKHIISTYPKRIASYEKRLKQAIHRRDQFQRTVDDLGPKLKTDEYKKLNDYRSYVRKCEKCAYWVIRFTKIIKYLEGKIAPLKTALEDAKKTLGRQHKPQTNVTHKKSTTRWTPVWSKSKYDKYRELQNIPAKWDVRKVVLIWYGDHIDPELRVFGKVTSHAVNGLLGSNTMLPIIGTTTAKIDYALTRKQYDQITI